MKLISLNTWGGSLFTNLKKFLNSQKDSTDVFCFQEVFQTEEKIEDKTFRPKFYMDLQNILSDFNGYFAPASKNHDLNGKVNYEIFFGLATFVKKNIKVEAIKGEMIYSERFADCGWDFKTLPKNIQIIKIKTTNEIYNIFNIHGTWYPSHKQDTKERIIQSKKILKLLNKASGKIILCGDFNLYPETESIQMIDKELINLIKRFEIKNTRNHKFSKYGNIQNFADYTFISKDINIENFEVPFLDISDHLPMILECN